MVSVILGYGPVGRELARQFSERGEVYRVVQRHGPQDLPPGGEFRAADVRDAQALRAACAGARALICALGFPYDSRLWAQAWPAAMANMLDVCAETRARFVFADNLYMYGPQTAPLSEDMPLTDYGRKPALRAKITRLWQEAHGAGRVEAVAVRASDFYGANAATSVLWELGVKRLAAGRSALVPYCPDHPHDYTYIADFARALRDLRDAPTECYGQAWHVPNAPTRSLRDLLSEAAALLGVAPRVNILPRPIAGLVGLINRPLYELREMSFQTDRPYLVDSGKFTRRFGWRTTPFAEGLAALAEAARR